MGRLRLIVVLAVLCSGCAGDENPAGPGTVTLTVSTSTTTTTTVAPTATAQFVFAPTAPAAQQPVFFNGFGSAPGRGTKIVTFSWDFGDGGTATGMSVSHTYADQALYVVTLTVTDDVGDSAKVSQIVGAIAPPVTTTIPPAPPASSSAQFVGNQTNPLIPSDLTLFFRLLTSASSLPEGADAAGLQAVDGDFTYTVTGTYRTPNGTTGTVSGRLEGVVEPKPAGDFKGTLTSNPTGCSATRNFSGPITATSLQWTAGSMVRNTCATNPLGWTSMDLVQTNAPPVTTTSTTTTTIPATQPTSPAITSQPQNQTISSRTTASLSVVATGTAPLTYQWHIGTSGVTTNPIAGATGSSFTTQALTSTTSYWVRVSNTAGSVDSSTATIMVAAPPPLTGGTISASPGGTGLAGVTQYTFHYATLPTGGVPPYSHSWNFGDGTSAGSGAAPTHVFPAAGTLKVVATATDSQGMSAQASTSVVIGNVTGTWNVAYMRSETNYDDTVVINQNQMQVTGTVNNDLDDGEPQCVGPVTAGSGVSSSRSLSVSSALSCDGVTVNISYVGVLNDALTSWTGHVTGGNAGCSSTTPCEFTATRSAGAVAVGPRKR